MSALRYLPSVERRVWVFAEVESAPGVRRPPPGQQAPGVVRSESYFLEPSSKGSDQRIHQIANKYAPNGEFSVSARIASEMTDDSETLRFSVSEDDATQVQAQVDR